MVEQRETRYKKGGDKLKSNKVKSLMALNGETQEDVAKVLDITRTSFNQKLNNKKKFNEKEIEALAKHYKKSVSYFFN